MTTLDVTDDFGNTGQVTVEEGVPPAYAARGATTVAQYQIMAQQDLSDKTLAANKEASDKQLALNQRQLDEAKTQYDTQQAQTQAQAERQSTYDTGRAQALQEGTSAIDRAFARFSPAYFDQYRQDYLGRQKDELNRQRDVATKELAFQTGRQGIANSQARVNQLGLIDENYGRTLAEQTSAAANAGEALRTSTANARQALIDQVAAAQSIGSPIAGATIGDVNTQLQTQRNAISGATSNAGDVVAALNAVPQPGALGDIFANVLRAGGAAFGGIQAGDIRTAVNRGLRGTDPG